MDPGLTLASLDLHAFFLSSKVAQTNDVPTHIEAYVQTILLVVRTNAAEDLAGLTRDIDPQQVDGATLSDVIALLDSDEDSVRFWVAGSLGNLGPRAKAAVPKSVQRRQPQNAETVQATRF
jgi:hypothetical protein